MWPREGKVQFAAGSNQFASTCEILWEEREMNGESSKGEKKKKRAIRHRAESKREKTEWEGDREMWLRTMFPAVILLSIEAERTEL